MFNIKPSLLLCIFACVVIIVTCTEAATTYSRNDVQTVIMNRKQQLAEVESALTEENVVLDAWELFGKSLSTYESSVSEKLNSKKEFIALKQRIEIELDLLQQLVKQNTNPSIMEVKSIANDMQIIEDEAAQQALLKAKQEASDKKAAEAKAAVEKKAKEESEKLAAEKKAKEEADKLASEKKAIEDAQKAAEQKAAAEKKAAEDAKIAEKKLNEEKKQKEAAEKKAAEQQAAAEKKAAAEMKAKEAAEKKAAEKKAADEKKAIEAENKAAEKKLNDERKKIIAENIVVVAVWGKSRVISNILSIFQTKGTIFTPTTKLLGSGSMPDAKKTLYVIIKSKSTGELSYILVSEGEEFNLNNKIPITTTKDKNKKSGMMFVGAHYGPSEVSPWVKDDFLSGAKITASAKVFGDPWPGVPKVMTVVGRSAAGEFSVKIVGEGGTVQEK